MDKQEKIHKGVPLIEGVLHFKSPHGLTSDDVIDVWTDDLDKSPMVVMIFEIVDDSKVRVLKSKEPHVQYKYSVRRHTGKFANNKQIKTK